MSTRLMTRTTPPFDTILHTQRVAYFCLSLSLSLTHTHTHTHSHSLAHSLLSLSRPFFAAGIYFWAKKKTLENTVTAAGCVWARDESSSNAAVATIPIVHCCYVHINIQGDPSEREYFKSHSPPKLEKKNVYALKKYIGVR